MRDLWKKDAHAQMQVHYKTETQVGNVTRIKGDLRKDPFFFWRCEVLKPHPLHTFSQYKGMYVYICICNFYKYLYSSLCYYKLRVFPFSCMMAVWNQHCTTVLSRLSGVSIIIIITVYFDLRFLECLSVFVSIKGLLSLLLLLLLCMHFKVNMACEVHVQENLKTMDIIFWPVMY